MTSGNSHRRNESVASTITAYRGPPEPPEETQDTLIRSNNDTPIVVGNDANRGHTDRNDDTEGRHGMPPKPPTLCSEAREASACSRNTRDSLRRSVSLRCNTFTDSEREFLEQLTIGGSDQDVARALQTVEDEELFFEHATPSHPKHNNGNESDIGWDTNHNSSSVDDATRDGDATSVATWERRGLDKSSRSSLTFSSHSNTKLNDTPHSESAGAAAPASVPSAIFGSEKRLEVLCRRRSDSSISLATLWRAHETGLAVTSYGSRRSLLRRESSVSSFGSNMSGLSVLFGSRPHPGASQEDVFRSGGGSSSNKNNLSSIKSMNITQTKGKISAKQFLAARAALPPKPRRSPHRRSKSASSSVLSPMGSLPKIPEPESVDPRAGKPTHTRARSSLSTYGKRKSVTFHDIDEELEFDTDKEAMTITPFDAVDTIPKRSQAVRRAKSESQIPLQDDAYDKEEDLTKEQRNLQLELEASNSSIPSLHHGTPIRQDSMSSIPSLHHGNALGDSISIMGRRNSIGSSIASLHHANHILQDSVSTFGSLHIGEPLRQESVSTIPSLHQGAPLRQESVSTIPSLHQGTPLRQESVSTIPSLHHGAPLRQESISTIPSLHHGRPVRQDSIASIPPNAMTQDEIVQHFSVTEDVADAWLKLASSENTMLQQDGHKRLSSLTNCSTASSLPDDVQIPDVATAPTISTEVDAAGDDDVSVLSPVSTREMISNIMGSTPKAVFLRQASLNTYEGVGVEVTEIDDHPIDAALSDTDSYYYQPPPDTSVFRNIPLFSSDGTIRTAGSFDDVSIFSSFGQQQRTSDVFRDIRRTLSDDNLSTIMGKNKEFLLQIPDSSVGDTSDTFADEFSDTGSVSTAWEMEFVSPAKGRYDAWNILQDDYVNGYGGGGTLGFRILGTSASDESSQPHVLSPPLMESIQAFLPLAKSGENFYMKYSMIRDGASLQTLLKQARGIKYSILAVETVDGEVFGSFTGQAWRKSWNYFGTGESFLWRMRHSRLEKTNGVLDQAQKESEIDVYPYTGENDFIQLCTHDRIAVGGGTTEDDSSKTKSSINKKSLSELDQDWGFGLALQSDLLRGSSSPCLTFGSPSLCKSQPAGSRFEIMNVELWTTTPSMTEEEAEKLQLGMLFLRPSHHNDSNNAKTFLNS